MKRRILIAVAAVMLLAMNVGAVTAPSQCIVGQECNNEALWCAPVYCVQVACDSPCGLTTVRTRAGAGSYLLVLPTVARALGKALHSAALTVVDRAK